MIGSSGLVMVGASSRTSDIRLILAMLMEIMTNTMDNIISDIIMLMT